MPTFAAVPTRTAVKTANYTAAPDQLVPVDTATPNANVTVTLPTAPANSAQVTVKHVAVGAGKTVTLACGGTDKFNTATGPTTVVLAVANQAVTVVYDAATGVWTALDAGVSAASLPSQTGQALRVLRVKSDETGAEWTPASRAVANVKAYGAVGDWQVKTTGTITTGTNILDDVTGGAFTATDVGKTILVHFAGAAGGVLRTTISGYVSPTRVQLTANAGTTATTKAYSYGTDDTTAITAAIAALRTLGAGYARTLYFPASSGAYMDTSLRSFDSTVGISIEGDSSYNWPDPTVIGTTPLASAWYYAGTATTGTFLSARSTQSFKLHGLGVRSDAQAFAGLAVDLSSASTATNALTYNADVSYCLIGDARDTMNVVDGVELGGVVVATLDHVAFIGGSRAARATSGPCTWSNAVTFRDCVWNRNYQQSVYVPAGAIVPRQWVFEGCTFEPVILPQYGIVFGDGEGIHFNNTGFWDNGRWFQQPGGHTLRALSFRGCRFETSAQSAFSLGIVSGFDLSKCELFGTGNAFAAGATVTNARIHGNDFNGVTDNSWIIPGGVQGWYAADGTLWQDTGRTTPATANATAVATWDDATGNANHVAQATAANRPLLETNVLNGKPVIRFDGTNDTLTLATWVSGAGAALAQPNVIFAVAKPANGTTATIVDAGQGQANEQAIAVATGATALHQAYAGTAITIGTEQLVFAIREVVFNGTAAAMLTNGGLDAAANVGTNTMQGVTIGANVTPANFLNGDVAEIIVLHGSQWIDPEARNRVRRYLASKYALALIA